MSNIAGLKVHWPYLGLETFGLGLDLEHLWPWPCRPVALAWPSTMLPSNTSHTGTEMDTHTYKHDTQS